MSFPVEEIEIQREPVATDQNTYMKFSLFHCVTSDTFRLYNNWNGTKSVLKHKLPLKYFQIQGGHSFTTKYINLKFCAILHII